jgi:hypothetical protein
LICIKIDFDQIPVPDKNKKSASNRDSTGFRGFSQEMLTFHVPKPKMGMDLPLLRVTVGQFDMVVEDSSILGT